MTVRRMKTYTGGQGYVYQYYFVGKREAKTSTNAPATEYIFDVTADRKVMFAVSIFLPEKAIQDWTTSHARTLNDAEQYGAVKMRLFQAFDEIENMMSQGRHLELNSATLDQLLSTLGVQ